MAHFAELNDKDVVTRVVVIDNNDILINGVESEEAGIQFCKQLYGLETNWIQTSYSSSFRHRFASTNYTYKRDHDAFIPPKPYSSWILNETTLSYEPPIPKPAVGEWVWVETLENWMPLNP